jgi:hypothetical protein
VKSNLSFFYAPQIWKAHDGIRTRDLFLTKEVLYRLSYMGARMLNRIRADEQFTHFTQSALEYWSGKRDSNPRPRAWKARALPTELFPLSPSGPSSIMVERGGFEPPKA